MTYVEFKGFFEALSKNISEDEFKQFYLNKYPSSDKGISLKGFMEFWKNSILTMGEDTVLNWFEMLGYDKSLFSLRSRCFILTVHSDHEISCTVRDSVQTDLDSKVNAMIIDAKGTDMETCQKENQGVKARYYLSKGVHCYSYGVTNMSNMPVEVT